MSLIDISTSLELRNPYKGADYTTTAAEDYANAVRIILYPHDGPVSAFVMIRRAMDAGANSDAVADALTDSLEAMGFLSSADASA